MWFIDGLDRTGPVLATEHQKAWTVGTFYGQFGSTLWLQSWIMIGCF